MSFLVPAVLWGLVAATIPLIIHLFSNRRIQTVEFSSIRFIKELEYETIRKLKIRQLILLILRTIAVILIVVAFARPVKLGYFPLGSSKTTQMVFLIDNSASLSALNDQDEILLSQSKAKARRILEEIEGDIHFQLWQTTPLLRIFSGEYNSVDEVAGYLEAINESAGSDDLWGAIDSILDRSAWEAQGGKISANNEFYIFSDFPGTVSDNWQFHKVRRQSDPNWHVFLLPVDDPGQNLRIRDIEVLTELRVAEQLVEIQTSIENQGDDDLRDIPVQLFFGDIPVGQAVSDVPAGKLKEFNFQAYPTHSESVEGNVIIPDDYYHFDNRRYFKFSVPDRINCVIAGSSEDQMELVEFALEAMNSDSVFVQFKRQNLTANSMLPLTPIDILLLVDPDLLSSFIVEQIADFQTLGGGVLVFLGDHSLNSNDNFLDQLGISGIVGIDSVAEGSYLSVSTPGNVHPVIEGLSIRNITQAMPEVYSSLNIVPKKNTKTVLEMSNGNPLLLHSEENNTYIFSVPPDLRWSSLPTSGLFLPLLHRLLVALVLGDDALYMKTIGESVQLPLEEEYLSAEIEMVKPSGNRSFLIPDYRQESVFFDKVDEPGVYRLLADRSVVLSFVANLAETEDPARRLSMDELDNYFPGGWVVTSEEDVSKAIVTARKGTELWLLFVLLAGTVLLIESWIGRVGEEQSHE